MADPLSETKDKAVETGKKVGSGALGLLKGIFKQVNPVGKHWKRNAIMFGGFAMTGVTLAALGFGVPIPVDPVSTTLTAAKAANPSAILHTVGDLGVNASQHAYNGANAAWHGVIDGGTYLAHADYTNGINGFLGHTAGGGGGGADLASNAINGADKLLPPQPVIPGLS